MIYYNIIVKEFNAYGQICVFDVMLFIEQCYLVYEEVSY